MSKDIGNLYAELSGLTPAGERSATETRMHHLMQQIADEAAISDVHSMCTSIPIDHDSWRCPDSSFGEHDLACLERATEYLHLRGLVERNGKLVRFVEAD